LLLQLAGGVLFAFVVGPEIQAVFGLAFLLF
jgi:hypothetical protein